MAISKFLVASIILFLLVLHQAQAIQINEMTTNARTDIKSVPRIDCGRACAGRCRLSKRPNLCQRACGSCCFRCNCVPPGTYGNHGACPCYANLTTHGNRRKCP